MVTAVTAATTSVPQTTGTERPVLTRTAFRVLSELGRKVDESAPELPQQAAAQLLSELFFAPLLTEMRKFPFGRELATGGQVESIFGQHLDQRIADTVAGCDPALSAQLMRYLDQTVPAATPPPAGCDRSDWATRAQARAARGAA